LVRPAPISQWIATVDVCRQYGRHHGGRVTIDA
jgi:hypothetical protein